jgi:hypothetical protein
MRAARSAFFAIVALLAAAGARAGAEDTGLDALLGLIPESPLTYDAAPVFGYVDLRAVERAAGVAAPASEAAFAAMAPAERQAWAAAYHRVVAGPEALRNFGQVIEQDKATVRKSLGFDWFSVDRAFGFWAPPLGVTVLAGEPALTGKADFDKALTRRGFARRAVKGVTVWHRLDDDVTALGLKDDFAAGDVLLGRIPRSERIAVLPGAVVAARNWPDVTAVLATRTGKPAPSAAATLVKAMLADLAPAEAAAIVQAAAFTLPQLGGDKGMADVLTDLFGPSGATDIDSLKARLEASGSALPAYPLALFLDLETGGDQVAMIALPYADRAAAEKAAAAIAGRLAAWTPKGMSEPMIQATGGVIETRVIDDPQLAAGVAGTFLSLAASGGKPPSAAARKAAEALQGGAVALVAVRRPAAAAGAGDRPGWVFARWLEAIYRREFLVLAVP